MRILMAGLMVTLMPLAGVVALLWLSGRVERARALVRARQVALTDAIHREMGAVAAPTVERRAGGGWRVRMAVPLESAETVGALVRIAGRSFAAWEPTANAGLEIVLTARRAARRPAGVEALPRGRGVGTGMPAAA